MARTVVIGGGFSGMAAAARLAKMGHDVTLLERAPTLGGALTTEHLEGFSWDAGPSTTLLPAVIRDLFRKTGRPLERELELEALPIIREHRFEDGSAIQLPGGSRAAQLNAFDALGSGLGAQWVDHVASYGDMWELLRKEWYERPFDPEVAPRTLNHLLSSRRSLHQHLQRSFSDSRLRLVAGHGVTCEGHDLRRTPVLAGVGSYLEQRFGSWTVSGGLAALGRALEERLATRGVTVLTHTNAADLIVRQGRVVGVRTPVGEVDADHVIVAIDPRRLPALASLLRRTSSTVPPTVIHVGLDGSVPDLPHEVVVHGEPSLIIRTRGRAPKGHAAWTLLVRGQLSEDPLLTLARRGIDIRAHAIARIDRSPSDLIEQWGGSPQGTLWRGSRTSHERLGPRTPIAGVLTAGAHATTGSGLPFAGLSAALVAAMIGRP